MLPDSFELLSLEDIGCFGDIPETGSTLEENAKIKADFVSQTYGLDCFSDDTGLLVDFLKGAPGVRSARYAGEHKSDADNRTKILHELKGAGDRSAHFKTVIHLNLAGDSHVFEGVVKGHITEREQGDGGFGYDPVFMPEGHDRTFGELPASVKNEIGHRGLAVGKLMDFLKKWS